MYIRAGLCLSITFQRILTTPAEKNNKVASGVDITMEIMAAQDISESL